jgi:hypothetical protein
MSLGNRPAQTTLMCLTLWVSPSILTSTIDKAVIVDSPRRTMGITVMRRITVRNRGA